MELYTLNINVNKQRLSFGENKPEIFSGDQGIDFVEFTFEDDMWNSPDIWAIFSRSKGTSYQVALEDNKVMIPAEVMQKRGYVYIGLMATDGENVQTSNVLQYSIGQGATNVDAITPSASIYEQFLADLDAYQTAVADLDDIESRITTAEGNVAMIEQAVTDLNEQLDDINVDISTINGQITTIQYNIGTAQSDIVSIQNGINTLNGQVAGLDTAVGTLSNRVTALQSSVTSLEGRLTTVGNTLTDFEGRLTTAGTTLTNLEGSISDAENDIQTVQDDIETIQSDIEDIQTAIEQNNVVTDVTAEGISLVDNHIADLSFMCVTDTASGDIASFPDGSGLAMKKAEVSLEPIQDLHGYDSPWPAGGGKNKVDITSAAVSTQTILYSVSLKAGTYTLSAICTNNASISGYLSIRLNGVAKGTITIASGDSGARKSATFTIADDATYDVVGSGASSGYTFTVANVQLESGSTMTDYAPYSNICPIDGYEDVRVSVRGFNQFDEEKLLNAQNWIKSGGYYTGTMAKMFTTFGPNTDSFWKNDLGYTGGICVTFTGYMSGGSTGRIQINYTDGRTSVGTFPSTASKVTVVSTEGKVVEKITCNYSSSGTVYVKDFCINLSDPSRNGTYEPYAGNDYTTDLEQTVYGGTVDLASGRLVVDRGYVAFDGSSDENWSYNVNYDGFRIQVVDANVNGIPANQLRSNIFVGANHRGSLGAGLNASGQILTYSGSTGADTQFLFFTTSITDLTEWRTWLSNNNTYLVYPLATPKTYQLTPQQIQTLVGANNVWSEDGTIEVEYIANLKDYIDKKINA